MIIISDYEQNNTNSEVDNENNKTIIKIQEIVFRWKQTDGN